MKIMKCSRITGLGISLRNAAVSDAQFILSLRTNEDLNQYLSPVSGFIEQQVAFLERYTRSSEEAFFIIEDGNGSPLGTIRIYDQRGDSFCWGSWIVVRDAPARTGTKSALLLYIYAFDHLGFVASHFDVRQDNRSVWRFHESCGATLVRENDLDRFYTLSRDNWSDMKKKYGSLYDLSEVRVIS